MRVITVFLSLALLVGLLPADASRHLTGKEPDRYSKRSFFVKTFEELKVSEATGKLSLETGIPSLDNAISKAGISEIRQVFRLNNGSPELYLKHEMNRIYLLISSESDIKSIREITEDLSASGEVDFSELNFLGSAAGARRNANEIPNDEMFYKQWYLMNTGFISSSGGGSGKIGADINIINAWNIETGSDSIIVAILDSGIEDDHPDLRQRIWINKDEVPGNGIDDDNNGYVDDTHGWDFAYNDKRPSDGFGHGTNIATVIGASTNNRIGFAGVDKNCKLMNCKNLNADNSGEYSWWSESIKYAVDNGADIINMSEGGDEPSRVLKTAVNYALDSDVLVVAAMMNKGDNRDYYPAIYDGVLAVGATDTDDRRCKRFSWGGGSCWGEHISVVAPGNKIYGLDYEDQSNFEVYWSGTSQSTAIVSGLSSLLLAQDPQRTRKELYSIIRQTAKDQVGDPREDAPGWDQFYGYGRIDCFAALTYGMEPTDLLKLTEPFEKPKDDKALEDQDSRKFERSTESRPPEPSTPR